MSKRFGRNQRRRAREALADREKRILQLGFALDMNRGLSKHLAKRLDELQQVLEDAVEMAGRMSVLFPSQHQKVDVNGLDYWRMPVEKKMSIYAEVPENRMNFCIQDLPVLLSTIDHDALSRAVHLTIEFNGKKIGYAVSKSALEVRQGDVMERELMRVLPKVVGQTLFGSRS